jgi:hypothetical protein
MNKQVVIVALIAVSVVGAIVGAILFSTRHNKVEVTADILKVRSHQIDAGSTIVVVDFRVHNPSTQQFLVRDVDVFLDTGDGKAIPGDIFSEMDATSMFEYYKVLGPKHNTTLIRRERLDSGQSVDRMIAARFDASDEAVQGRKAIRLIIHDADGPKSEIVEAPR